MGRAHNATRFENESMTLCERVYALLERIHADGDHRFHEDKIVEYGMQIMSVTRTYVVYFFAINDRLTNLDYNGALKAGQMLLEHEAMLHKIASGRRIDHGVVN